MIERGLDALERITGKRPRGYRSPAWELSKSTFSLLEEYGFEYDASQLGADRPYWVRDAGRQTTLVETPVGLGTYRFRALHDGAVARPAGWKSAVPCRGNMARGL